MTKLTTLTQLHKLQERYPFSEEELEILVRCHDHLQAQQQQQQQHNDDDDFLTQLAVSSPYSYFFLPGDELRARVSWLEENVLPPGFSNKLRAALSADPFVTYANEGEDQSLERFLEGIADTGRRGPKEALKVFYRILGDEDDLEIAANDLVDLTLRLAIASEALVTSNLDKDDCLKKLQLVQESSSSTRSLVESIQTFCDPCITNATFVEWAETTAPLFSAPLSTFIHHLVFHGSPYPAARIPYSLPQVEHESGTVPMQDPALLFSLSLISRKFTGSVSRHISDRCYGLSIRSMSILTLFLSCLAAPSTSYLST